jgi:hypothetical protein
LASVRPRHGRVVRQFQEERLVTGRQPKRVCQGGQGARVRPLPLVVFEGR